MVKFADGRSAFVKQAVNDETAAALRAEHRIYAYVSAPFVPALLGWHDGKLPVLVIEDLTAYTWPPPWNGPRVEAILRTLRELAGTPPPPCLPRLRDDDGLGEGWDAVAANPTPFLRLGLATPEWLEKALPALLAADGAATLHGDAFLHFDVRSDNLCFRGNRALLVDWNWACIGNPLVDIALWLPSLRVEGGPHPRELMPEQPALAARVAGFFAVRAALPPPPAAPCLRRVQLAQLRAALRWVAEELELESPTAISGR